VIRIKELFLKLKLFFGFAPEKVPAKREPAALPGSFSEQSRALADALALPNAPAAEDIGSKINSCLPSDVAEALRVQFPYSITTVMEDETGAVVAVPEVYPVDIGEDFLDLLDLQVKSEFDILAASTSRGSREALHLSVEDFSEDQCAIRIARSLVDVHERFGLVGSYGKPTAEATPGGRVRVTVSFFTSQVANSDELP